MARSRRPWHLIPGEKVEMFTLVLTWGVFLVNTASVLCAKRSLYVPLSLSAILPANIAI